MREEEKKQPSRKLGIKQFFKKRWVYPAIYIGAAAILLTTFLFLQAREDNNIAEENEFGYANPDRQMAEEDALEVGNPVEDFDWPVANQDKVEVVTYFYDSQATEEEQEAAIISDGNSFYPSTGIAISAKSGEAFDVMSAMSGTVKSVNEDSVLGNVVTIEHADGVETVYQALQEVQVTEGEDVKQGDVIGKAGRSMLNEEAGVHTHFEIRKDGIPVNPLNYFEKSLATLQEDEVETGETSGEEEATDEKDASDEEDAKDEDSSDEDKKSDEDEKSNEDANESNED